MIGVVDGLPPGLPPDPLGADVDRELEIAIANASRRLEETLGPPPPTVLPDAMATHARERGGVFTIETARSHGLTRQSLHLARTWLPATTRLPRSGASKCSLAVRRAKRS